MNLSKNVKKYFVNALRGLGVSFLTDLEVAEFLDDPNTTFKTVFDKISEAIDFQLQKDAKSNDKKLERATAFNCKTTAVLLSRNTFGVDKQSIDGKIITDLYGINDFNTEVAARTIIQQLLSGVNEQKILNKEEKQQAIDVWVQIRDCEYIAKYQTNPNSQVSCDEFYSKKVLNHIKKKIKNEAMQGDEQKTNNFLNATIDGQARMYLEANNILLKESEDICKKQNRDPKTELQVRDVLLALSNDCQVKQVVTYFQERSQQQREFERQPGQKEVTKDNKIGNLIDKKSSKTLAKAGAIIYSDEFKLKKGKEGWRGYKALYDRINSFLQNIYSPVQSIGFTERIMVRKGFLSVKNIGKEQENKKITDLTQHWEVNIETEIPTQYLNNNNEPMNYAGEFYHETKSRLLADKMRLERLQADIADRELVYEDTQDLEQEAAFLQERIKRAENGLSKLEQARTHSSFSDPELQKGFTSKIEEYILDDKKKQDKQQIQAQEDVEESEDELDDEQQVQTQGSVEEIEEEIETAPVLATKQFTKNESMHKSANDDMIDALMEFQAVANGTTQNQRRAKINMAKELFAQQASGISDNEIEAMADRFLNTECDSLIKQLGDLTQSGVDKKANGTCEINGKEYCKERLKSDDYQLRAIDANSIIKQFVKDDLQQNLYRDEFRQYQVDEKRTEIWQEINK